jgi:hypothetical protein
VVAERGAVVVDVEAAGAGEQGVDRDPGLEPCEGCAREADATVVQAPTQYAAEPLDLFTRTLDQFHAFIDGALRQPPPDRRTR